MDRVGVRGMALISCATFPELVTTTGSLLDVDSAACRPKKLV